MTTVPAPAPTTTPPLSSGWKTSEFLLSLFASIVGAVLASGLPTDNIVVRVAGVAASVLAAMGYTAGRSKLKAAAAAETKP